MSYTKEYFILHPCGRCKKKQQFVSTRKFRINANKNKLDIWLIYQCRKCRHTLNVPIFERTPAHKIPRELYDLFLANDQELAQKYAADSGFLKSRHYVIQK